ncbi:MAG: aminoglycoside phosphotransferase family protein [Alphaproteobacteria bacterium]
MTGNDARARMQAQIPAMAAALNTLGLTGSDPVEPEQLSLLPTTGLAHDHIRIHGTGLVLRVPRQSQLSLDAVSNLHYQRACFERAAPSGRTPHLHGAIEPQPDIPMGSLVVDYIEGKPIVLPDELPNAARTLAAIHALPLPPITGRPPLKAPADPIDDTLNEVLAQAQYLYAETAAVPDDSVKQIAEEIAWATAFASSAVTPPVTLISFDAHPGNFIQEQGPADEARAVLVDLEKARYGVPGFDLAHASLYTSTTWDIATYAELSLESVSGFYDTWMKTIPASLQDQARQWLLPCRRMMWLWSVTWCAKWAVESGLSLLESKHSAISTEDWSADNTDRALVDHVADRVTTYLDPSIIDRVRQDWAEGSPLSDLLT